MTQQLLTIGERGGVNASGVLVALAASEQLLEQGARACKIEIGSGNGAARQGAERTEDGRDRAAAGSEHAATIGCLDVVVSLGRNLRPEPQLFRTRSERHEV